MKQTKITFNVNGLDKFKSQFKGYRTRVGIVGDKASRGGPINNAELGFIQLVGSITKRIPPRDWLIMPIRRNARRLVAAMDGAQIKSALKRGDIKKVFKLMGLVAEGFIQEAFESRGFGTWARNAPSTIDRKGSSQPLIDTAQLRRAVSSDVTVKGKVV